MSKPTHSDQRISARLLSQVLHGAQRIPTDQQADVTSSAPGPLLVVAGAGAGKTETMASRVLWLIANGHAEPDEVLGLTFTRKAAQELGQRIRKQLRVLAGSPKLRDLDPGGELYEKLTNQAPTVSTYDSFAGDLVKEYGLLVPVEPDARLITNAELYAIAHRVVVDYAQPLSTSNQISSVVETLIALVTAMDSELADPRAIREVSADFADDITTLPKGKGQRDNLNQTMVNWRDTQQLRVEYLGLVEALLEELAAEGVTTFTQQMAHAARLARDHAPVRAGQRRRFRVVMLDEYQDTSHAQRVLLSHLFGTPADVADERAIDPDLTVTAVGDPMQAIYGWRGATVENLEEFVNDFPTEEAPAPKKELTTSWRNPATVLQLANAVSDEVFSGQERPVAALAPKPDAPGGDVSLGLFATPEEEINFVADTMQREYEASRQRRQADPTAPGFSGAVLVRKNKHSQPIAEALAERGVPYEILGLGGLLHVPEVADIVALARMLVKPGDVRAALRILGGPMVGLGVADIEALSQRARNLRGAREYPDLPEDPVERLIAQLAAETEEQPDQLAGLTDAIADLGERSRYSEEGLKRLEDLSAKLRYLRTYSLAKSLPDLFVDIDTVFGIRTEVLAHGGANAGVHLDKLFSFIASFPGDSLGALLDYFDLALEQEDGLEAGEVTLRSDRVQVMTVHKAKGLEWDVVSVLHADAKTYGARASTFVSNVAKLPPEEIDKTDFNTRKDVENYGKDVIAEDRSNNAEELARLFYVAITRTERVLTVTASDSPYEHLETLATTAPDCVVSWADGEAGEAGEAEEAREQEETQPDIKTGFFPSFEVPDNIARGAQRVRAAMAEGNLPPAVSGETFEFWEKETTALIAEHEALAAPEVNIEIPLELTATDLVSIKADPVQFARRQRRPVPFKPNTYAKRGTAFHQWLEERFGQTSLLDEDDLPGMDEEVIDAEDLEFLKQAFEASEWADRTPHHVEEPFEVQIGSTIVRGRMDAIFRKPDGSWFIVDWKTGHKPHGSELRAAEIQLAVYREAWRRLVAEDDHVTAAFFYVRSGETFAPSPLPDGAELADLLATATTRTPAE